MLMVCARNREQVLTTTLSLKLLYLVMFQSVQFLLNDGRFQILKIIVWLGL
jgi:hypothetical protein